MISFNFAYTFLFFAQIHFPKDRAVSDQIQEFNRRVAQRNSRRDPADRYPRQRTWLQKLDLRDDLEVYFLLFGVIYGGAATLFAVYCGPDSAAANSLIYQGDLEFAFMRQFGGYWLYIGWPAIMSCLAFGMAKKGPLADAMRALALGAIIITVSLRGFLYFFGG